MQVELHKKQVAVFINLNSVGYIYKESEDTGTIVMNSGEEIKIISGLGELLNKIKEHPYTVNIL